jgi:hypothetical protein
MDDDEFEQRLHQLVARAHESDVSVRGSYDVQTSETDNRSLQLQITKVVNNTGSGLLSRE